MASGSPGNIGLIKFANNTLTKYTTDNSDIPENDVERVLVDEDDKIWIAMDKYVAVFDQTNWNVLEEITTANDIRGMDLDQAGNVWIATYSDGIANYINDQWNFYSPDNTTEITYLGNIFIDNNNDILTCSYNEGLSKFSDFDWSKIDISNCPLANDVTDQIEFETNGTAWIRNRWGQILKFKDNNWEVFDTETLIPESEAILYLHVDQNDHKWIVFRNEAYEFFTLFYDDVNWSVFSIPALPNITEMVRSFVVSYDGTPILAMREGVYEFTGTEWVNSQIYDEVEWDDLGFLALGSNNDLWITNISRLYKKDNSGINQMSFDTLIDMPSAIITSLVVDQNNNLWFTLVNTSERRLIFFDGESFIVDRTLEFNSPNQSLPSTLIDNNNLLWIVDRGLLPQIYKRNGPDLWDTLNVKNSNILSDITVSDISQNPANGDFWIAHPIFGITVYNEQGNILPVESPFKKTEEIAIDIFPNPFKNQISIHYTIKRAKSLSLLLYDQNGRLIKSIFKDKRHQEGSYDYSLNNLNLDPGIYYCIIKSSKDIYARKIIRIE